MPCTVTTTCEPSAAVTLPAPKGTPCYTAPTLGEIARHISDRHPAGPPPGGIVPPGAYVIEARKTVVGDGTEVRRLLPQRTLRTIGAWCFLDHYGPDEVSRGPGMQVPPHPHIGLQTVSWLFQGLVLHRDSLGSRLLIRPGELNLMTVELRGALRPGDRTRP